MTMFVLSTVATVLIAVLALSLALAGYRMLKGPGYAEKLAPYVTDTVLVLTSSDVPALEDFARSLSLVFMKVPPPAGAPADHYSIDHSAALAVLDPQARMAGVIQPPLDSGAIAQDLLALTRNAR